MALLYKVCALLMLRQWRAVRSVKINLKWNNQKVIDISNFPRFLRLRSQKHGFEFFAGGHNKQLENFENKKAGMCFETVLKVQQWDVLFQNNHLVSSKFSDLTLVTAV